MCSDNWSSQITRPNRADRLVGRAAHCLTLPYFNLVLPIRLGILQASDWWTDTYYLKHSHATPKFPYYFYELTALLIGSANELTHIAHLCVHLASTCARRVHSPIPTGPMPRGAKDPESCSPGEKDVRLRGITLISEATNSRLPLRALCGV